MQRIIVHVEGGLIHKIQNIPQGLSVEVRDYDTDGIDPERLTDTPDGEAAVSVYEGQNIWRIMNESNPNPVR